MTSKEQESVAEGRRLPWLRHLLAVLLLMLVAVARWPVLSAADPRGDEGVYLEAFASVQAGQSPYGVDGFFYPHAFARAGAFLLAHLGAGETVTVLRAANLAGLCLSFWIAAAWLPLSPVRRWAACAAVLCLSPAVHAGLDLGNVSFLVIGLTLAALVCWPRWPLLAGVLLGAGVALKPLAPAVILVLLIHRARRGGRRHLVAASTALAVGALLLLPLANVREMLGQEMVPLAHARSFSLHRLLNLFGLEVGMAQLALAAGLLAVFGVRWRALGPSQLLCYAVATVSLATPLVWNHTLIVALPVESMALALAWRRASEARGRASAGRSPIWRRYEPILVAIGVLMIHAGTAAGIDDLRAVVQVALLLMIGFTPAVMCGYVIRYGGCGDPA